MDAISRIEREQMKREIPSFRIGDTVRVHVKVIEGSRERIQDFEGVVIGRRGRSNRKSITVRKVSYGVGVERVFPLHSPYVEGIDVVREGHVRRAKLYYLRGLKGRSARIAEKGIAVSGTTSPTGEEKETVSASEENRNATRG